ncbi:hypothetical protein HBB16_04470 [Pseudonocardia sp. MCCB 268]|nr:hypothetical protein [Pseudonocardia cytotoxica]
MTHKIRTTKRPDLEIEVDDAELLDLQRQAHRRRAAGPRQACPSAKPAGETGRSRRCLEPRSRQRGSPWRDCPCRRDRR